MKFQSLTQDLLKFAGDALVVNLFEDAKAPGGATAAVDKALGGVIAARIKKGVFKGKIGSVLSLPTYGKLPVENVVVTGLGKKEELTIEKVRLAAAAAAKQLQGLRAKKSASILHGAGAGGLDVKDVACAITEASRLATYKFDKYLTKKDDNGKKPAGAAAMFLIDNKTTTAKAVAAGISQGNIIADAVILARDLVNEPPNVLNAEELAKRAKKLDNGKTLRVTVLLPKEIEKLGMGAFLGVNKGSCDEPRFIILKYTGAPKSKENTCVIGKGITFDSGGINLKPSNSMDEMKSDMSGAAATLGIMQALAAMRAPVNVTGLIPATSNMPGGCAQTVGDIVRAMNGKTIEVMNTDAEGRLVLCDAICYANKLKLSPIIDLATLTGACVVALGPTCSGVMGNNRDLAAKILAAAETAGERMWELPMWDEFADMIKSDNADIKNVGGRYAGAMTGAKFLEFFVDKTPWVHLDIAGPSFVDKNSGYTPKGGTGAGTRTLLRYFLEKTK